jgi:S1-C subfamily serine protease
MFVAAALAMAGIGASHVADQLAAASSISPTLGVVPGVWAPGTPHTGSPWREPPAASMPSVPSLPSAPSAPPSAAVTPPPRASRGHLSAPGSSGTAGGLLDLPALAGKVDPGLVDINTQFGQPHVQAAGTGLVLDSSGVVLTNNHVISGASTINVTDIGNGQTYPATVVGYDRAHDIAVLQLQGASSLPTVAIGDSSTVAIADPVAAIGNAGGRGGTPSIVAGTVSALNQAATVSDELTGGVEQLAGLIQIAADIQPGDSGGPLVNSAGEVIGIDTAGAAGSRASPAGDGLAIPINDAITISKQIQAGTASASVHIGETGVLGVFVQDSGGPGRRHARLAHRHSATVPGAAVTGTVTGSPAGQAGLVTGDVIVSLDGTAIDSSSALITVLAAHHPGDSVQVVWADPAGQQHTATVILTPGPPD